MLEAPAVAVAAERGIQSGRFSLRLPQVADEPVLVAAGQDPGVARWTEWPQPYTADDARDFVRTRVRSELAEGSGVTFVIERGGLVVGGVGLNGIDASGAAGVGYWLTVGARGVGLAAEALWHVARWAFDVIGLRQLVWNALVGNLDSLATARAVGFVPEGTLRGSVTHRGEVRDCWAASLSPSDLREPVARLRVGEVRAPGDLRLRRADPEVAIAAEARLPFSVCQADDLWAVEERGALMAVVALLSRGGRAWAIPAALTPGDAGSAAADAGRRAMEDYARRVLGLDTP